MPSPLSHAIAGAGLGPVFLRRRELRKPLLCGAICAVLPDVDLILKPFGVGDDVWLGHRALSHSLFTAIAISTLVTVLLFRGDEWKARRGIIWLYLSCAAVSHGLLDAMTTYAPGVRLFEPFSTVAYKFPWRPITGSWLGSDASWFARGVRALIVEIEWVWLPAAAVAAAGLVARVRPDALKEGGR